MAGTFDVRRIEARQSCGIQRGRTRCGSARRGVAGMAWSGSAPHGTVWRGLARRGMAGLVRRGPATLGLASQGLAGMETAILSAVTI